MKKLSGEIILKKSEIEILLEHFESNHWLISLRKGTHSYEAALRYVREEVSKSGLHFEDFGTSEKELNELELLGGITAAKMWIDYFRKDPRNDGFLELATKEMVKHNLQLKDIGTSIREITEIKIAMHKKLALWWLKHLRESPGGNSCENRFREEFAQTGLSLNDVGTSEEELGQIRKTGNETMKKVSALIISHLN